MRRIVLMATMLLVGTWVCLRDSDVSISAVSCAEQATTEQQNVDAEKEAIRQVIQQYFDVTDRRDYESLKKAFHPDAKLMSVGKNGLNQMTLEQWWGRVSRISGNIDRTMTISSIEVQGIAAIVKTDESRGGRYRSSDFISLLKIDDQWKIVNKLLSTKLNV